MGPFTAVVSLTAKTTAMRGRLALTVYLGLRFKMPYAGMDEFQVPTDPEAQEGRCNNVVVSIDIVKLRGLTQTLSSYIPSYNYAPASDYANRF